MGASGCCQRDRHMCMLLAAGGSRQRAHPNCPLALLCTGHRHDLLPAASRSRHSARADRSTTMVRCTGPAGWSFCAPPAAQVPPAVASNPHPHSPSSKGFVAGAFVSHLNKHMLLGVTLGAAAGAYYHQVGAQGRRDAGTQGAPVSIVNPSNLTPNPSCPGIRGARRAPGDGPHRSSHPRRPALACRQHDLSVRAFID